MSDTRTAARKLDVLIPSFNRPAKLHHILKTGLALGIEETHFVVIDDGSTLSEDVQGLGAADTERVCRSFPAERVTYVRNAENVGLAIALTRYYREIGRARYTMLVNDKDEFIAKQPIVSALRKLDADADVSMVMLPLRQIDRATDDRPLLFDYPRMSGKDFLARYVQDTNLQHAGMYGIIRAEAIRKAGVPRPLNLRRFGLEDAFGIDIDFLMMIATTGDFEFESEAHVRRSVVAGMTERFPLTFAYSYYQYAKRAMLELRQRGFVDSKTVRTYIRWWLLLILRGLVVAYQPVHGTELEPGVGRIQPHLRMPILLYLIREALRFGVAPSAEMIGLYRMAGKLIIDDWWKRVRGLPSARDRGGASHRTA